MKTSHILFAIALFMGIFATFYIELIGSIKMTTENKPIDRISAFWLKFYDIKVTQKFSNPIRHIKVTGGKDKDLYLNIQKAPADKNSLYSINPQNFSYKIVNDSLLIHIESRFADITLQQNVPLASIEARQVSVCLNNIIQDQLHIAAIDNARFSVSKPFQRSDQRDSIGELTIQAANASSVYLDNLIVNTSNAVMHDAVLNYTSSTQMDSLAVHLHGRSTVTSNFKESRIASMRILGNKEYFKKEFLGNGAKSIEMRP